MGNVSGLVDSSLLEQLLIDASLVAGKFLREKAYDPGLIEWKEENDPVTSRDKEAELLIIDTICSGVDMKIIGEESGVSKDRSNLKYTVIIDPLDGTRSYLGREFDTAVSIAFEEEGRLIAGAVYDFMRDLLYVGFQGETYVLHSNKKFPFGMFIEKPQFGILINADSHKLCEENALKIALMREKPEFYLTGRRGSIALGMAHTAVGIHDSMVHYPGKNPGNIWDVAAGTYLLECQKFILRDSTGRSFNYKDPSNGFLAVKEKDLHLLGKYF